MLKNALLTTTALVLCASLSLAGQNGGMAKSRAALAKMLSHATIVHPSTRGSQQPIRNTPPNLANAIFNNYSKDANAQFISWYGYLADNYSSCSLYSAYSICFHRTADNAFAFTPTTNVTTKNVTVPLFSSNPSAHYQVNIYSSVGGLPGSVLAHSKRFTASDTSLCCTASRTVTIKGNLTAGTQYFIGVVGVCCNAKGGWTMEDTDFSGTATDYFHQKETYTRSTYCGSGLVTVCSSPWHASTQFPVTGAVVLK